MRDSFVLYVRYLENIEILSMEQRGTLITALMKYAAGQDIPKMDGATGMAYSFIKSQMDRDFEKYDEVCKKRSESGKMGGRPKKISDIEKTKKANGFSEKQKNPDNEYGNEYGNVNDKDNNNMSSRTSPDRPVYPYKDVIDYLNLKAGTAFRSTSKDTQKHIRARINEGYTLEDFKRVIDVKVSQWGKEPRSGEKDMRVYLRPSTLFGTKFEGYLQEKPAGANAVSVRNNNNFDRRPYDFESLERSLIGDR